MNAEVYAEALWRVIQKGQSPKKSIVALKNVLLQNGRTLLLARIARAAARIAAREDRRNGIVLTLARNEDLQPAQKEIIGMLAEMKVQKEEVKILIDKNLIGGWRLEGRGHLADASHKKQLLSIYENVIHS